MKMQVDDILKDTSMAEIESAIYEVWYGDCKNVSQRSKEILQALLLRLRTLKEKE